MNPYHDAMLDEFVNYLNYHGNEGVVTKDSFLGPPEGHVYEVYSSATEWGLFVGLEVNNGGEGGAALLIARFEEYPDEAYNPGETKIEMLTMLFDTITTPIIMGGKGVYVEGSK
jgi:hypothetical protein